MHKSNNLKHAFRLAAICCFAVILISGLGGCGSPTEKANAYYQKGMELLDKGDLAKARLEFRNALQIRATMTKAWYGLALAAEKQGDWQGMFELLNKVVEQDPKHLEAQVKLGRLLLASGQLDKALETSNKALALSKDDVSVLTLRAAVLLKLDDAKGAVENANLALGKDPDYIDALVVLATERLNANDAAKAVEYLDRGLQKNEKNLALQLIKIQALDKLSKLDLAEQVFRKLIAYYPDTVEIRYALARFLLSHDRKAEAEAEFRAAVVQKPGDLQAKLALVRFLNTVQGSAAGRKELEAYARKEPGNFPLRFALVSLYQEQGDVKSAEQALREIIDKEKHSDTVLKAKGMLAANLLTGGDRKAATQLVEEILAVDKRNEQALILKAGMEIDGQKLEEAISDLRTVLRDVPDSSRALLLLGRAHDLAGSPELADENYLHAFQASKLAPPYGLTYVQFLLKRNQTQRAEKVLEDLLSATPGHLPALKLLAQAKISRGDWVGAQQVADEVKRRGDSDNVSEQIMGAIFAGKKNYADSISAFKRAYEAAPSQVQPIVALIRTYLLAGKTKEATNFLDSVLQANPNNTSARLMQGQLHAMNGEGQQAVASFNAVIEHEPKSAIGYHQLAVFHLRNQQTNEAQKAIDRGLAAVPGDFALRLAQAGLFEMTGRYDDAIKEYEAILKERPDSEVVVNNLASLLTDYRTDKPSLNRAYELAQRFKKSDIPQFKDTFGWANYRIGKYGDAASLLESATQQLPDLPVFHYHLGMNHLAKADKAAARKELELALKLAGEKPFEQAEEIRKVLKTL